MAVVRLEIHDRSATATLERGEVLNAIYQAMVNELRAACRAVAANPIVRSLVITGDQRAFSAGADLAMLEPLMDAPAGHRAFVRDLNALLFELEEAPFITIAMVDGYALAGGLELLLACDLAVAAEEATIGDQHANFGLMPGGGATQRLPRRIGPQRASELLYTGCRLTGAEAAAIGLVLRAVPRARLFEAVNALTADLATKSRVGLAFTKRAVHRGAELPLREAVNQESAALFEYFAASPTPRAGLDAFHDSVRRPDFPE
jgi:enoyl-CoA hydratase/carnithine racemase